jgi:outer membrane protein assembly factor BamB
MYMKNRILPILLAFAVLGLVLTACTGTSTAVNSWSGVTINDTYVFYAGGSQILALRAENGNVAWSYPEKASPSRAFLAEPAIAGEQLIVGDYGKLLTSLSVRDGSQNWQFAEAKGRYIDSALVTESLIIAPNSDNHLYALDLNGSKQWSFAAENSFWARPVSDSTSVYAPSLDHFLYSVNIKTGKMIWKTDLKSSLVARPILENGIIYVGNLVGGFFAVNSTNGKIIWSQTVAGGVWAAPVMVDGKLYFGDQTGKINILSASDGKVVKIIDAGSAVLGSGAVLPNGVVFGSENGELMLFGLNGEKIWPRTLKGSLYSNLIVKGDRLLVVTTKGDKLLIAMDLSGNENWYYSVKK